MATLDIAHQAKILERLFPALPEADVEIASRIHELMGVSPGAMWEWTRTGPCRLTGLRRLEFSLDMRDVYSEHVLDLPNDFDLVDFWDKYPGAFQEIFTALPKLEQLTIRLVPKLRNFPYLNDLNTLFREAARPKLFAALASLLPSQHGCLTSLQLQDFILDGNAFVVFLSHHKTTLREIKFVNSLLRAGTWKDAFLDIRAVVPSAVVTLDGYFHQVSGPHFFVESRLIHVDGGRPRSKSECYSHDSPFYFERDFGLDFRVAKTRRFANFWKGEMAYPVEMEEDTQVEHFLAGNSMEEIEPSSPYSWSRDFTEIEVNRKVDRRR